MTDTPGKKQGNLVGGQMHNQNQNMNVPGAGAYGSPGKNHHNFEDEEAEDHEEEEDDDDELVDNRNNVITQSELFRSYAE